MATQPMEPVSEIRPQFQICPQGIGNLMGALAKAKKSFKPVIKSSKNPFYKSRYADLAEVLAATTEALSDNELAVTQLVSSNAGDALIYTLLGHSSGEWISSLLPVPVSKMDAQGIGSAITYGRRYAYSGIVNVGSEDDDDGNAASAVDDKKIGEEFDQRTEGQRTLSDYQVRAWESGKQKGVRTESQIAAYFKKLGIPEVSEMHREDFNDAIKWLLNPNIKVDLTEDLQQSLEAVSGNQPSGEELFPVKKVKK